MSTESEKKARDHLNKVMSTRAVDLGLRWNEIARRAGMTYGNLHRIRTGAITLTDLAKRGLERALQWQPGSVEGVLSGREPQPVEPERIDPAKLILMEAYAAYAEAYGIPAALEIIKRDVDEINAARAARRRSSERPETA